jgi:hypothetical protein
LPDRPPARDLFAGLLAASERVSGPEHPVTLTVRANLAYRTGRAGEADRRPSRGSPTCADTTIPWMQNRRLRFQFS